MRLFHSVLVLPIVVLAACTSLPVGGNDIFAPIGGAANSIPGPAGDPYQTQGIGSLPPEDLAQSGATADPETASFENTVAAALEQTEAPIEATGPIDPATGLPIEQTAGVDPNDESINLAESSQAKQKVQRDIAARELQAARDKLVIVQPNPETVPMAEVNVARYARTTTNAVGEKIYRRSSFGSGQSSRSRCARFADADAAQRVFLQNGGPQKDKLKLDPDGDGFACKWSPDPYRALSVPGQ